MEAKIGELLWEDKAAFMMSLNSITLEKPNKPTMRYTLRTLLLSLTIIVVVVLLLVFRTFTTLRLQKKEQERIMQSRAILQKLGPAISNVDEFSALVVSYFYSNDEKLLDPIRTDAEKLVSDSVAMAGFASTDKSNSSSYKELAGILHQLVTLPPSALQIQQLQDTGAVAAKQGIPLVEKFKTIAAGLEEAKRKILSDAYGRSINLTRQTLVFARVISGLLILILLASAWFIYQDIKARKRKEEDLKRSNISLGQEVDKKTSVLKQAEEKYRRLYESMMDAYSMTTMDGKVLEYNASFRDMLGYTDAELAKKTFMDLTPVKWHDFEKAIIQHQILKKKYSQVYEKEYIHKSGKIFPVELRTFLLNDSKGKPEAMWAIIRDISERKKTEKEKERVSYLLNERVKELTVLYRVCKVFQSENDSTEEILKQIVSILPSAWQYSNITAARIVLEKWDIRTPNYGTAFHKQKAGFDAPGGQKGLIEVIYVDKRPAESEDAFLAEERELLNMLCEMLSIFLARRHEMEMNKEMEQRMLNQKLQEQKNVSRAIISAEERERNKIGQELHDNINQILASIKLYLGMMRRKDLSEAEQAEMLEGAVSMVDSAIEEIRTLSKSQVTPLKGVNLKDLIQSLVDKLDHSTAIKTDFVYSMNGKPIGDDLKLNIYRIVQEQINNVLKHSGASAINIAVKAGHSSLSVSVADNGQGFDPANKRKGIGVSNMINRVESFNRELTIESSPGKGCKMEINIPY